MRMNPLKCFLTVVTGKFLGFVIPRDGITVDPAKTKAILEMKPPTNLRELKGLQGIKPTSEDSSQTYQEGVNCFHAL